VQVRDGWMRQVDPVGPGPVVAGVDGSESSLAAAVYAAREADRRRRPLLLVHATPWSAGRAAVTGPSALFSQQLEDGAQALLRDAVSEVRERSGATQVRTAVLDEHPVPALAKLSTEASLVVLGRRGMTGVPGVLAGSTASGLVHHARCPVLVLPEESDPPDDAPRRVVVAVEGRPDDEDLLAFAVAEAGLRGTGVTAVHAWRDVVLEAEVGGFGSSVDWSGVAQEERRLLSESVAGWRDKQPDVLIREDVVRARPVQALLDAAATAELLVVGHRHRGVFSRLGSTVHGLLHRSPCPLAVVPTGDLVP
jgi:nucleotide-binding universal stress UspA family protein